MYKIFFEVVLFKNKFRVIVSLAIYNPVFGSTNYQLI